MISTWIWSRLPGNTWVKSLIAVIAVLVVIALLYEVVFPWLAPLLPLQEQTVE